MSTLIYNKDIIANFKPLGLLIDPEESHSKSTMKGILPVTLFFLDNLFKNAIFP